MPAEGKGGGSGSFLPIHDNDITEALGLGGIRHVLAVGAQQDVAVLDLLLEAQRLFLAVIEYEELAIGVFGHVAHLASATKEEIDRHQRRTV